MARYEIIDVDAHENLKFLNSGRGNYVVREETDSVEGLFRAARRDPRKRLAVVDRENRQVTRLYANPAKAYLNNPLDATSAFAGVGLFFAALFAVALLRK